MTYYLKLRKNITLEGDIQLASREILHLFGDVCAITKGEVEKIPDFVPAGQKLTNIREGEIIGFVASEPRISSEKLVLYLSFIQEMWCQDICFDGKPFSANR